MNITPEEIDLVSSLLPGGELGARVVAIRLVTSALSSARAMLAAPQMPAVGTFGWAVAHHKPMRRREWLRASPVDEHDHAKLQLLVASTWIWCLPVVTTNTECRWISLLNGGRVQLNVFDYEALDWEVIE